MALITFVQPLIPQMYFNCGTFSFSLFDGTICWGAADVNIMTNCSSLPGTERYSGMCDFQN